MNITPKNGTTSGFTYEYHYVLNPRVTLYPGGKLKIRGERGWFSFVSITTNAQGVTWVDVMDKDYRFRSFHVEAIKGIPPKRRNKVVKFDER